MEQRVALGMEAASLALVAFNPGGGPRPGRQWGHAQHQRADPDGRATRPNRTRFVGRRGLRSAAGAGGLAFARSKTCARRSVRFGVPKPQRLPTRHPQPAIQESGPGTGKRHPPSGGAIIVGQVRSSGSVPRMPQPALPPVRAVRENPHVLPQTARVCRDRSHRSPAAEAARTDRR
jgi:hypothetical protein